MRTTPLLLLLLPLSSCGPNEPKDRSTSVPVRISVHLDDDTPLAGVVVDVCGNVQKNTDENGTVMTSVNRREGDICPITVVCPPETTSPSGETQQLAIRHLSAPGKTESGLQILPVTFRCQAQRNAHVLIVRTRGADPLSVQLMGTRAAVTDDNGIAHVVVTGKTDEEIEIVLDTTGQPHLLPTMPSRRLRLPAQSRFLLFEQTFSTRPKPTRPGKAPIRHRGPVRL